LIASNAFSLPAKLFSIFVKLAFLSSLIFSLNCSLASKSHFLVLNSSLKFLIEEFNFFLSVFNLVFVSSLKVEKTFLISNLLFSLKVFILVFIILLFVLI